MNKRKQKLIIGFCTPAAVLGAATGVAGLVIGLKSKEPSIPPAFAEKTITFNATNGTKFAKGSKSKVTVESGTTFDLIDKPNVICPKGTHFAGWVDENNDLVYGAKAIRNDVKLTPALINGESSEYATVKFEEGTDPTGVVLQGNTNVSVMKKHRFYMVNRPSASAVDSKGRAYTFKGWKYKDSISGHKAGDLVGENDVITTSITLIPYFVQSVSVTWNPGEGTIKRGTTTTTHELGSTFKEFNQPQLNAPMGEKGVKYFDGWYSDAEFKNALSEDYEVKKDITAYAKWSEKPGEDEKYTILEFVEPVVEASGIHWNIAPSPYVYIEKKITPFASVNKPTIYDDDKNYRVSSDRYESSPDGVTWTEIKDAKTTTFTDKTFIRPIMEFAIDGVYVYGDDVVSPEEKVTYRATIEGPATSTDVTWKIYADPDCKEEITDPDIAAINSETGLLTVGSPKDTYTIYVQATSKLNSDAKSSPAAVTIKMPYVDSADIWYYDETAKKWMYFSHEDLCDTSTSTITPHFINGESTKAINKTDDFNYNLILGDQITMLNANFLSGCSGFNAEIYLNNVEYIQESFLSGCTSFNQTLNLGKIKYIAPNFLANCTGFNSPIDFSNNTVLYEIGDDFMIGCTSYNSSLVLPTKPSLILGNNFLQNCSSFTQSLLIPSNITYIGDFFMNGCDGFTGKITVNCPITDASCPGSTYCLVSNDSTSAIHETGFSVDGTSAEAFNQKFPTQHKSGAYRKQSGTKGDVTEEEWATALQLLLDSSRLKITCVEQYGNYLEDGTPEYEEDPMTDTYQIDVADDKSLIEKNTEKGGEYTALIRQDPTSSIWFTYDLDSTGNIENVASKDRTARAFVKENVEGIKTIPYNAWNLNTKTSQYEYSNQIDEGWCLTTNTAAVKFDDAKKVLSFTTYEKTQYSNAEGTFESNYSLRTRSYTFSYSPDKIKLPDGWSWQSPVQATYDSATKTSSYTFTNAISNEQLQWVIVNLTDLKDHIKQDDQTYYQFGLYNSDGSTLLPIRNGTYTAESGLNRIDPKVWNVANQKESVSAYSQGADGSDETGYKHILFQPGNIYYADPLSVDDDKLIVCFAPHASTTGTTTFKLQESKYLDFRTSVGTYDWDRTITGHNSELKFYKDAEHTTEFMGGWTDKTKDLTLYLRVKCDYGDTWQPAWTISPTPHGPYSQTESSGIRFDDTESDIYFNEPDKLTAAGITVNFSAAPKKETIDGVDYWVLDATITFDHTKSFVTYTGMTVWASYDIVEKA